MNDVGHIPPTISQKCYSKAVARVSLSYITLPGTINVSGMFRAEKDYSRAKICNLGRMMWYDHETKTGFCDL